MNEEDGLRTLGVVIEGMHCERCVKTLESALDGMEGVGFVDVKLGRAELRFLPQLVSEADVEQVIVTAGYSVQRNIPRKGFVGRFIDRMIASNEKNFGDQRLDCCNLSSETAPNAKTSKE